MSVPAPDPRTVHVEHTRERLRALIDDRALSIHLQPIVDLRHGRVMGYEALTRVAPESGFPDPGALYEAANETGMASELEHLSRQVTLESTVDWPRDVQ
ncbi:MAG: EAL domain-containing protein [Phycisphaerales bacterium]|nr:EAL domain-containing protein [Phycisphaerales bacterium]